MTAFRTGLPTLVAICALGAVQIAHATDPGGGALTRWFDGIDSDSNLRITAAELERYGLLIFQRTDTDGSGALDREELTAAMLESFRKRSRSRFAELDADENGAISKSELTAAVIRQFSCMDADWDGAVTLEEARAALPPQRPK